MTDKLLINAEHLHEAASLAAMMPSPERAGFDGDAIGEFIDGTTFHPPLDDMSVAYGILIGKLVVDVRDSRG
jgi:hypothetical protein